jgi:hypothetical protein
MVKLYGALLSLALTTSLALALPLPTHYDRNLLNRRTNLDEQFSRRENVLDAYVDLATREPNFWGSFKKAFRDVGRVAEKGLKVAEKIVDNPIVQEVVSVIPGGSQIMAAEKIVEGTIGNVEKLAKTAKEAGRSLGVGNLRGALGNIKEIKRDAKQILKSTRGRPRPPPPPPRRRNHRRELEVDEEPLRRDLDANEELLGREIR